MRFILALLALSGCGGSQPRYPIVPLLELAKNSCRDLSSIDAAVKNIRGVGWSDFSPAPTSPLVAKKHELENTSGKTTPLDARYFRIDYKGQNLELRISRTRHENHAAGTDHILISCHTFDFDENNLFDAASVVEWVKRTPERSKVANDGRILSWRPGLIDGQDSFEVLQVGPELKGAGFNGILIILDNKVKAQAQ